jgi:hypothetical protein
MRPLSLLPKSQKALFSGLVAQALEGSLVKRFLRRKNRLKKL